MQRNQVNTVCVKRQSWRRVFLTWTSEVLPFWCLHLLPDTGLLYWMASQSQNHFSASRFSLQSISSAEQCQVWKPKLLSILPPISLPHCSSPAFSFELPQGRQFCLAPFPLTLSTMYVYRALYIINGDSNSLEHSFNSWNPWSLNIKQWSIYAYLVTLLCPPEDLKRTCWICTV